MTLLKTILNLPIISRIRRNHGLEHASLHVLSRKHPGLSMGGYSDFNGFWLLGNLEEEDVRAGVEEALARMKAGEAALAVHPNCGTNIATAGSIAGLAGLLGMVGVGRSRRDKLERLPVVAVFATIALILAQPLGLTFQKLITTSGAPESLEVEKITQSFRGRTKAYRILTRG